MSKIDTAVYYGIGAIVIVAAIVYYTTKVEVGNNVKAGIMSDDDVDKRIDELIYKKWGKKIDPKEREAFHGRTQDVDDGNGNVKCYYGIIAQVYRDADDRIGQGVRVIWNMTDDRRALAEGLPPTINVRDPDIDPFRDYMPLKRTGGYIKDTDRYGQTFNFGKTPDFADPAPKKDNNGGIAD